MERAGPRLSAVQSSSSELIPKGFPCFGRSQCARAFGHFSPRSPGIYGYFPGIFWHLMALFPGNSTGTPSYATGRLVAGRRSLSPALSKYMVGDRGDVRVLTGSLEPIEQKHIKLPFGIGRPPPTPLCRENTLARSPHLWGSFPIDGLTSVCPRTILSTTVRGVGITPVSIEADGFIKEAERDRL